MPKKLVNPFETLSNDSKDQVKEATKVLPKKLVNPFENNNEPKIIEKPKPLPGKIEPAKASWMRKNSSSDEEVKKPNDRPIPKKLDTSAFEAA